MFLRGWDDLANLAITLRSQAPPVQLALKTGLAEQAVPGSAIVPAGEAIAPDPGERVSCQSCRSEVSRSLE